MQSANNVCQDQNKLYKPIKIINIYDDADADALAYWRKLNERVEKSGPGL